MVDRGCKSMCARELKKHCCCCCCCCCVLHPFPAFFVLLLQVEREVAKDEKLIERELETEVLSIESAFSRVLGIFKR